LPTPQSQNGTATRRLALTGLKTGHYAGKKTPKTEGRFLRGFPVKHAGRKGRAQDEDRAPGGFRFILHGAGTCAYQVQVAGEELHHENRCGGGVWVVAFDECAGVRSENA